MYNHFKLTYFKYNTMKSSTFFGYIFHTDSME